jgi:hypothetical protein
MKIILNNLCYDFHLHFNKAIENYIYFRHINLIDQIKVIEITCENHKHLKYISI